MPSLRAISLKLISVLLFMVMAALVKVATQEVPAGQAVFFRSLFALPIVLLFLLHRGELSVALRTSNPWGHAWRGLVGTSAMMLGFASLSLLPLPEVTAIGYAAPILTVVLAALFLGERIRLVRASAVIAGLVGVLIISYPSFSVGLSGPGKAALALGAAFALASAALRAVAVVTVRALVRKERASTVVFYFSCAATLIGLASLPFGWVMPSYMALLCLICAGLVGGIAQLVVTTAYALAETSVVAPFDYASMILAIAFGLMFFDEVPTVYTLIGGSLVIAAGLGIIYRERQLGKAKARLAAAAKQPLA